MMPRSGLDYTVRRELAVGGFDPDVPRAGYYRMQLRRNAVRAGVRVWYGPPHDPDTGEELDRGWRWQAHVNGAAIDLERVWPNCANDPIDCTEYDHLCALQTWASERATDSALADPTRPIDLLTAPLPF